MDYNNINAAEKLSKAEQSKASRLIEAVRNWQAGYVEAGEALIELAGLDNNKPLWMGTTFPDYCQVTFDLERSKMYRLMRAAKVVRNLEKFDQLPTTENQADTLSGLKPENQVAVWEACLERSERPTIAIIKAVRAELFPQKASKSGGTPLTPVLTKLNNVSSRLADTVKNVGKLPLDDTGRESLSRYIQKVRDQLQKLEQFTVPMAEAA